MNAMRETVAFLERAIPVMLTLGEGDLNDVPWEGFLDASAMRVRLLMVQSLQLTREAQALLSTRHELARLLQERRLALYALYGLLAGSNTDDWDASVRKWRRLTRTHFVPWTLDACEAEADDALKELNSLLWSSDTHTSGVTYLGWRDLRRMDRAGRKVQYVFHKVFSGFDMMDFVGTAWAAYTDGEMYQRVIMGEYTRSAVHIVQRLSPTMFIIRYDEQYLTMAVNVHMMYLVFRVTNEQGVTHCMRSIPMPQVQKAIEGPNDLWATNLVWFRWEPLHENSRDFRLYAGGAIAGSDIGYANRWLIELLATLIRAESAVTRRSLLLSKGENDQPCGRQMDEISE